MQPEGHQDSCTVHCWYAPSISFQTSSRGTVAIASRSDDGFIDVPDWYPVGGGEAGYIAPYPPDPNVVYAADYEGLITRFDKRTGQVQNIAPEAVRSGKYRFLRTAPVLFAPTDPHRVIQSAAVAMRERVPVAVESDPDLPSLYADEDALVTVLLNLLDNAYKYTPTEKRIALRAYRDGASMVFSVEDNGIGIPPREQKRIFRKFYQIDQRLARETGGVGLGLSIVDYIVRAHGGSVRVQSRAGAGSTFLVSLPCRGF